MLTRHTFRITGTAIVAGALLAMFSAARLGAQQSAAPTIPDSKTVVSYFISEGSARSGFHPTDRELARWAFEAWQRSAEGGLRFESTIESQALIRLHWAEPIDGQYGETQPLMVGGRLGAALFVRPDMESLGPDIASRASRDPLLRDSIVYLTCLHELGHALGLTHTRDVRDIMYFFGYGGDIVDYFGRYRSQLRSRSDIATTSGLSAVDVSRLRALYNLRDRRPGRVSWRERAIGGERFLAPVIDQSNPSLITVVADWPLTVAK